MTSVEKKSFREKYNERILHFLSLSLSFFALLHLKKEKSDPLRDFGKIFYIFLKKVAKIV